MLKIGSKCPADWVYQMFKIDLPTLRPFLQKKNYNKFKKKKKIDNLDGIIKAWNQENLMIDLLSQNI
jgi:hypothetical protein